MLGCLIRLVLLIFVISVLVRLSLLAFFISMLTSGSWGNFQGASGSYPHAAKSWCMGLISQIEAQEAMGNAGAWRQVPPFSKSSSSRGVGLTGYERPELARS
jgi:hypothetical protein